MSGAWRVELVDSTGARVGSIPPAGLPTIDLYAMEIEQVTLECPLDCEAGAALATAAILPLLEVQVWRDLVDENEVVTPGRIVTMGPVTDAPVDFATGIIKVTFWGSLTHLDHTLTGPAQLTNEAPNARFVEDLADWKRWKTTFVEAEGFASIVWLDFDEDVTEITWAESGVGGVPNAPAADTNWVKLDGSGLAADEELQCYADLTVEASELAPTRVTMRVCFWFPPGQTFDTPDPGAVGRTNLDHALVVTVHDPAAAGGFAEPTPLGYIDFLTPPACVNWDDIWAGNYDDIECTVEIPQGTGEVLVHCAMIPPRLVCYATLVEINVDRPLEVSPIATTRVGDLIDHAQDTAYGHLDRRITATLTGSPTTIADGLPIYESDRRSCYQVALDEPQQSGAIEWRVSYEPTGATVEYGVPPIGTTIAAPISISEHAGSGHVTSAIMHRMWTDASTSITGQSSVGQTRSDVAAALDPDLLGWEEVFVAPPGVARWNLDGWTAARLAETSRPDAFELIFDPSAPNTEPWRDGTVKLLDQVWVMIWRDGIEWAEPQLWQVRHIQLVPESDGVAASIVPVVA